MLVNVTYIVNDNLIKGRLVYVSCHYIKGTIFIEVINLFYKIYRKLLKSKDLPKNLNIILPDIYTVPLAISPTSG